MNRREAITTAVAAVAGAALGVVPNVAAPVVGEFFISLAERNQSPTLKNRPPDGHFDFGRGRLCPFWYCESDAHILTYRGLNE